MASLDTLPADQRAVLQMVLQQGRTYDQIAEMLKIDRAGVRDRARSALDALGPHTRVPAERRALITDYLLGQLPKTLDEQTRKQLGASASERAWARVLSSELSPMARGPLPEIPVDSGDGEPVGVAVDEPEPQPAKPDRKRREAPAADDEQADGEPAADDEQADGEPAAPTERPTSRRGGAILLGLVALAAVAALVIVLATSGGSSHKNASSSASASSSTSTPAATSTTGSRAQLVAQVNLVPPTPSKKTAGLAQIVRQAANLGLVIVAQGVPANTAHDAYAVWLYNSPSDSHILGFVNPGVKSNGKLQTAGTLPANAARYKQLLVTLETQAKPQAPGKIVLQGSLRLS